MTRPRPPRPAPMSTLDRRIAEAKAELDGLEKRAYLDRLRACIDDWWKIRGFKAPNA